MDGVAARSTEVGVPMELNAGNSPTLTIMALSWRASDYMMAEMKKGSW